MCVSRVWCWCSVIPVKGHRADRAWADPLLHIPAPPHCGDIMGFQRVIFWLVLKMSLFISLEWMMRVINNQVCACLDVSVVCGGAKWTGWRPLKAHIKMIERAAWSTGAKNPEKCFSKWGVPRLTVPLIKMLTPREWSAVSLHCCTFSFWHADVNFHLSAHEQTPVSTALVNEVTCAGVCVCVMASVCMQEPVWILDLLNKDIFVKLGYFKHSLHL